MIRGRRRRHVLVAMLAAALTAIAATGPAEAKVPVRFKVYKGFSAPGTPSAYNRVGVVKTGDPDAENVLVLNPGTSAGGGYFNPLAKSIVRKLHGWQVWSVERRENFVEDQSMLDKAKRGKASAEEVFDYYLGYLNDPSVTEHYQPVSTDQVPFARNWGMNVEIHDLRRIVIAASKNGRNVVMGGHSLGGSITTAYATWDFRGDPGADDLSGLVLIDGASNPMAISADSANTALQDLQSSSPWLAFGGIPAPLAGLFGTVGSSAAKLDPNGPSVLGSWALLPAYLKAPVPVDNEAGYGYATDADTSPPSLVAAQVHSGRVDESGGEPHGWDRAGAITPIQRWADMFSGWATRRLDGTAWYHPRRLTIDSGAVGNGLPNPAQDVLNVDAVHGEDLSGKLRIYAFGAALGGERVPDAARALAQQSGIPNRNLTLANRQSTYAHNDPNSAAPNVNAFFKKLVPFLRKTK